MHLPKHEATSLADLSLAGTQKDAYYIDKEGAYPFAIDIPILNFISVTEKRVLIPNILTLKLGQILKEKNIRIGITIM